MFSDLLPVDANAVLQRPYGKRLAIMLYGSVARGTNNDMSDIDILELVSSAPEPLQIGRVNITQYTPSHLRELAERGSLFILHLIKEGKILEDTNGILSRTLDCYIEPSDYSSLWSQLAVLSGAIDPAAKDVLKYCSGLGKLGIYILRTAAYAKTAERGVPQFDVGDLCTVLNDPQLGNVLSFRKKETVSFDEIKIIREAIERLVPNIENNNSGSIESYVVTHSTRRDLACLFSTVLSNGTPSIDYSALTLPPL